MESTMHALIDFMTTDYGLLSAAVIAFMLGMGVWFVRFFIRHVAEDTARHEQEMKLAMHDRPATGH